MPLKIAALFLIALMLPACKSDLIPAKHKSDRSEKLTIRKQTMDDKKFWNLIALLDWKKTGDDTAVVKPVVDVLAALTSKEIFAFDDLLTKKLHALDTRAICKAIYAGESDPDNGDDYISADEFLYIRCVIVANGQQYYEGYLARPSNAARSLEFESILSIASAAFEQKTGDSYEYDSPTTYESFHNKAGWAPTKATKEGWATDSKLPPGNSRPGK